MSEKENIKKLKTPSRIRFFESHRFSKQCSLTSIRIFGFLRLLILAEEKRTSEKIVLVFNLKVPAQKRVTKVILAGFQLLGQKWPQSGRQGAGSEEAAGRAGRVRNPPGAGRLRGQPG